MQVDQQRAARLANEAFDIWEAGRLEEAKAKFLEAVVLADPSHSATPDMHLKLASLTAALGDADGATERYSTAIALELAIHSDKSSPAMRIMRYFLTQHLIESNLPLKALEVLEPAIAADPDSWLLYASQADALNILGRKSESRRAAEQAISFASSPKKVAELQARFSSVLAVDPASPSNG